MLASAWGCFLLRGKQAVLSSSQRDKQLFPVRANHLQYTANSRLLLSFPYLQTPPGREQGSELDQQLTEICGKFSLGKEPVYVLIRDEGRAWQATLGSKRHH